MDGFTRKKDAIAFSTFRDYTGRLPTERGDMIVPPMLEVSNPRQLMQTPHGLRTVQDLYESLDSCIGMHKAGKRLQQCLDAYLENPNIDTRATLDRARSAHDVELAKSTKVAEYERVEARPTNGAGVEA